jgi:hypothetical protein
MGNAFSRISLVIDLAKDWYEPDTLVLREPAKYESLRSRMVMHETLHWWQQLGHGFMTWLAMEDWQRLTEFESTNTVPVPGPRIREFVRKNELLGFSPWTLNESLTRFWDMHICGPLDLLDTEQADKRFTDNQFWERYNALKRTGRLTGPDGTGYSDLAYALAMEGAGGRYARPYQLVIEKTSPKVAGIVFPIAAHFAFQTSRPADYFAQFVELLAPYVQTLPPGDIEKLWVSFYFTARSLIFPVIKEANEQPLFPIIEIRESGLNSHPGYASGLNAMEYWTAQLPKSNLGKEISRRKPELPESFVGLLALDIFMATPGIPDHRGGLYQMFPPPVVRFADGQIWLLGDVHRRELHPEWNEIERGLPKWQKMAADALEIDKRWNKLLRARYI